MATQPANVVNSADGDIGFDPVLLAVLSNRFDAINRQMANTLQRSGRSAAISVARDFSCAIVTPVRRRRVAGSSVWHGTPG
jgi:N-methylhydantoinase B/oxoprolinase/acetone carboxylase alpha subunit